MSDFPPRKRASRRNWMDSLIELEAAPKIPLVNVAREIGHFMLQLDSTKVTYHSQKSEMSLERFRMLGLDKGLSIHAFTDGYEEVLQSGMMDSLGRPRRGIWLLDLPCADNAMLWRGIIESQIPLVVEAPTDVAWVEQCISHLFLPCITHNIPDLSTSAVSFCRRLLGKTDNAMLVALGTYRDVLTFVGRGALFEHALKAMNSLPGSEIGFSSDRRAHLLRSGDRILPRKRGSE